MPSQTGLSNGARVKATGSHKDGWDQEFMCRQQSQRCLGRSPLFAEVEEQEGQGSDAEDQLLHYIRVAQVTNFSWCNLTAVVSRSSVGVYLSLALKDKSCLVR